MRILLYILLGVMVISLDTSAQNRKASNDKISFPDSEGTDVYPSFPGGQTAFSAFVKKNLHWPAGLKREGKVIIEFIVEKNGTLSELKVKKSLDREYDDEAIRVMKISPAWIAGRKLTAQGSKTASYSMTLPVVFSLH